MSKLVELLENRQENQTVHKIQNLQETQLGQLQLKIMHLIRTIDLQTIRFVKITTQN